MASDVWGRRASEAVPGVFPTSTEDWSTTYPTNFGVPQPTPEVTDPKAFVGACVVPALLGPFLALDVELGAHMPRLPRPSLPCHSLTVSSHNPRPGVPAGERALTP